MSAICGHDVVLPHLRVTAPVAALRLRRVRGRGLEPAAAFAAAHAVLGRAYAGATFITSGHVNGGPSGHITWSSYHTADPVERVVAQLLATRGSAGYDGAGPSHVFRDPPEEPREVVDVFPPGVPCSFRPPHLVDGCVILHSTMARPTRSAPLPPTPPPLVPSPHVSAPAGQSTLEAADPTPLAEISLYVDGLEDQLPDRYGCEPFVMGRICGLLEALWQLNQHVNHCASIGFVELEVGEREPLVALRERYAHVQGLALVPLDDWRGAVRGALTSVALDVPVHGVCSLMAIRDHMLRGIDSGIAA